MERPISVGYVEGYDDAIYEMHSTINSAIQNNPTNLLNVLNIIIERMYAQRVHLEQLNELLEEQMYEQDPFEEMDMTWDEVEQGIECDTDDIINAIYEGIANGQLTVIIGGRQ